MTSNQWKSYYEENAASLLDVPWDRGAELTPDERVAISASLKAFQAGESSEGQHLYKYAKAYAERTADAPYVAAIRLFIAEEQRHARDLGRFLKLNEIPLVRTTFTDFVFRKLRHLFAGLEMSIGVLITAEIIAKVYYAALREATQSLILRRICDQILRDEVMHVQFQAEQLTILRRNRSHRAMVITMAAQRFLFFGTTLIVGVLHRHAICRGGYRFAKWWRVCWSEFNAAFSDAVPHQNPVHGGPTHTHR